MKIYPIKVRSESDVAALAKATAEMFEEARTLVKQDLEKSFNKDFDVQNVYTIQPWPAFWNELGEPKRSFGLTATTKRRIR